MLWLRDCLELLWGYAAVLLAVGMLLHFSQTGFALSAKKLTPDPKRLDPLKKLKDLPGENLAQTLKGLLLLPFAAAAFWFVLDAELPRLMLLSKLSPAAGSVQMLEGIRGLLTKAAVILVVLGVLDFYRQRRKIHKQLKMTKQEVRQEFKEQEGDPQIKGRRRQMQRELARRRMMSDVPSSTVVVTNPTHFAVALRYEPGEGAVPLVTAKGLDYLALRIRSVAEDHGVPIVENPPLAQALYRSVEVGQEIPAELYRTVAEILAYIYKLRGAGV